MIDKKLLDFILERKYIFWDIKDVDKLSETAILARIIDYGTLEDLKTVYQILWNKRFKEAFLSNLMDKQWKIKERININDYKMIYLLALKLNLDDKIPLWDIIKQAKRTSSFSMKN